MKLSIALALLTLSSVAAARPTPPTSPVGEATLPSALTPREAAPDADRVDAPQSDELRPGARVVATADTAFRMAPLGAALVTGVYVRRTYGVDASGRYETSYLQAGAGVMVTPASLEPRVHAEYVPAPYLVLRAEFGGVRYFGTNYGLLSFDSAGAAFGDSELSERRGDERAAWAMKGSFSVTPRLKVGPVLVQNELGVTAFRFDDHGPYVYEAENDTLLATTDVVLTSRTDLLAEVFGGPGARTLLVGPMLDVTRTGDTQLTRTRVGGSAYFVPAERWANLRRPRLFAMSGVNLSDPNRAGEPYATFGFGADLE